LLKKSEPMSAKPEVVRFVLEKLAVPRWLKMMQGFVKGKPWHRWTGQAREAGRVKAQQFKTREALTERAGLGSSEASRSRVLGGMLDRTTMDIHKRLAKVKDPRHKQLLTMSRSKVDPMMSTTPATRQASVQNRIKTLKMKKPEAVRNVLGLPSKPLPFPTKANSREAYLKMAPAHMVPPPGQTGAFNTMMRSAPPELQPRFESIREQIKARYAVQAVQAERVALEGARTVRPGRAYIPTRRPGDWI